METHRVRVEQALNSFLPDLEDMRESQSHIRSTQAKLFDQMDSVERLLRDLDPQRADR